MKDISTILVGWCAYVVEIYVIYTSLLAARRWKIWSFWCDLAMRIPLQRIPPTKLLQKKFIALTTISTFQLFAFHNCLISKASPFKGTALKYMLRRQSSWNIYIFRRSKLLVLLDLWVDCCQRAPTFLDKTWFLPSPPPALELLHFRKQQITFTRPCPISLANLFHTLFVCSST